MLESIDEGFAPIEAVTDDNGRVDDYSPGTETRLEVHERGVEEGVLRLFEIRSNVEKARGLAAMSSAIAGCRILIVEDEYFIALEIQRALIGDGAEVLGPVPSLEKAWTILETTAPDFAILDVNLEGESSFSIADRLRENGIPFMFVTGYDEWAIPDRYRGVPRMTKPYSIGSLVDLVGDLVGA